MALTVQNIWDDVKARVKNVGDVSLSQQLQSASIVNREIRDIIIDSDPESIMSTGSNISVTSDQQTETKPSDFETLRAQGAGLYKVKTDGTLDGQIAKIQPGDNTEGYYLTDTSIVINKLKTQTVVLRYIPTLADLTATSDTFVVDTRFREAVRAGVLVQYYWLKGDFKDIQYTNWSAEYTSRLNELGNLINRTPNVVSLPNFSKSF